MKLRLLIITGLVLFIHVIRAQNNSGSQISAIHNLSVAYYTVEQHMVDSIEKVYPEITFSIVNSFDISEVELKIYRADNNTILFSKTYSLSQSPLADESGKIIFSIENNIVTIKPSTQLTLNTYRYEIVTKNKQGETNVPFSDIK